MTVVRFECSMRKMYRLPYRLNWNTTLQALTLLQQAVVPKPKRDVKLYRPIRVSRFDLTICLVVWQSVKYGKLNI